MLQTGVTEKVDKKMGSWGFHSRFLSYDPQVVGKSGFFQFCADLRKNLSMLEQFTYMHLKGFVTSFHKMLLFTI